MNEFDKAVRDKVDEAPRALTAAREAGDEYRIHLHMARVQDLLDLAAEHGIDTRGWVDPVPEESTARGR